VAAEVRVEIYPDRPAVDMRGVYRLVNRTPSSIDAVHILVDRQVVTRSLAFQPVSARLERVDAEVGYRIFTFASTLKPGESLQLAFDVSYQPRGFPNSSFPTDVVANGASFNRRWMPIIGYQPVFELAVTEARKRFGLPPQPEPAAQDDMEARRYR